MSKQPETGAAAEPAAVTRLRLLGAEWRAAAENAFAGVADAPERYLAAGRWVAAWLERLRAFPPGQAPAAEHDEADDAAAASALLAAWDARDSAAAAPRAVMPLATAERAALTAAAFAIRYGEVADWLAARRRRQAMAAAGPGWLVLDEAGDPAGDPFIPYRRLEVDSETGFGVLAQTRPDEAFVTVIHEVRVVHVDQATGRLTIENCGSSWTYTSADKREEMIASLRADKKPGSRSGGS